MLLAGCSGPEAESVYAASSLQELVTEILSERKPRLQFQASSVLARQIREGARADVFISADPEWIDAVRPIDRYDWVSNRLALIVPKDGPDIDLETVESLALGSEETPIGRYSRQALTRLPPRVIYGFNARDVLSKVSQGAVQGGIVYATDAAVDPGVRVCRLLDVRMTYIVALLRPEGRAIFEELRSPRALEIARRRGFE